MKTIKKSLLIFSVFLFTFFAEIAVDIACGGEVDPYDYYVSYFHNNVQGDEYLPFAYNQMAYLNSEQDVESESEINSREWGHYLHVAATDVYQIMYQADSVTSSRLATYNGNIAALPDSLQKNSFVQGLSKHKKALKYFRFAKRCEPYADVAFDPWDPEPRDSLGMSVLAKEALALTKSTRDKFLKLRYAYQAERMFHYAGMHEDSKAVYERFIMNNKSKTAVKGWALALYAGSIRRLGNTGQSAFLFSKVFASNPERRIQAYKNYYYNSAPLRAALEYATTAEEKANIWAINGFGNPEFNLESLHQVYQYEPKSALNGVLLVREVNKLEQALIETSDIAKVSYNYYFADSDNTNYKDSVKAANLKQLNEIRNFALKLAAERKYPQPELGTLTAAYLSWMEHKDSLAMDYLRALKPDQLNEKLRDQYRITTLLISANSLKNGKVLDEIALLPTLKWLEEKRSAENSVEAARQFANRSGTAENRFSRTARNFYQQILAPAYLKLGDTARAALAMSKGDPGSYQATAFLHQYMSAKSMQDLLKYKNKAAGNEMTDYLAKSLVWFSDDDFYELFGTTYLRTHQYDKAIQMFAKLPAGYKFFTPENWYSDASNPKLYANPFTETINDYPKKYVSEKGAFTKKTFAAEMLRLQHLTVSDKKNAALHYYKMANAVYQTGYFGNSWYLISYNWSSYDNTAPLKHAYDADFKIAETAKRWYLKARTLSNDPDFKAKCTFMLAKCEQKEVIVNAQINAFSQWDINDMRYQNFSAAYYGNAYFKELKSKYSKTPFYKIAAGECSYLSDFITRK
ncbi:hypothetical protein ACTHQF_05585 [Pedobacter sp. SAFR-022]|uniref:hypothetical protein n=1 Tax=Pedobacter sp. SAFR-022 TaxID=3436861 RepID=UPI003F7CE03A